MITTVTVLSGVVLIAALVQLARIDWATQRLPNIITLPLLAVGLVWAFYAAENLSLHFLGAVMGYVIFWAVEVTYRLVRKRDGLGRGDAKLLAVGGAWCGAWALPVIVLVSSVAALAYVLPKEESPEAKIPYGPFLAIGIGGVWLAQRWF